MVCVRASAKRIQFAAVITIVGPLFLVEIINFVIRPSRRRQQSLQVICTTCSIQNLHTLRTAWFAVWQNHSIATKTYLGLNGCIEF